MKQKTKFCPQCGAEITEKKAKKCPGCGKKLPKSIFKRWWFWVIVGIVFIAIVSASGNDAETTTSTDGSDTTTTATTAVTTVATTAAKVYEEVDLQTMLDDLNSNALKAEKTYQNKLVIVTGKIRNFDSDGEYISIVPVNASDWSFDTVMCYIKNDGQLNFLLEKSTGDVVTIKGKVKSIGEVLGYSLDIDEIE